MLRKILSFVMVLIFSLAAAAPVFASSSSHAGNVYVMTNSPTGNKVIAYNRAEDGRLTYQGSYATGGDGSGVGVTVPPDPLGSQNGLLLSPDGGWLFAVNAGSNSVSMFKVRSGGELKLVSKVASGGSYPVSLAYRDNILYVLNAAGDGSIAGFYAADGHLVRIKGATRSLNANTPADGAQPQILESPAQVGFSPDGHYLVVTDKGGVSKQGRILVYRLLAGAIPSASPVITTTATPVPFAFTFDGYGHLVVLDAAVSSVTTYAISGSGSLATLSSVATGQAATCWIVFNGKYLLTNNTGSGTVSALQSAADGSLTLLNATAATTGSGTLPLDAGISPDGHFFYTLETGAGAVGEFMVKSDGSLVSLGINDGLPIVGGTQGIAVR